MKFLLYISVSVLPLLSVGQVTRVNTPAKSTSVNEKDANGQPNGLWVLTQPSAMGESGYTEFGKYDHGYKYGPWYKLDSEGDLMAMETFRNSVLDGEVKYFTKGKLNAIGYYKGLNPDREYDTIMVEDPVTGLQVLRTVHNDRNTVRHGPWRFYDSDNGRLIREEEYQVDSLIHIKQFPMTKADSLYYQKREAQMPHNKRKSGGGSKRMMLYK